MPLNYSTAVKNARMNTTVSEIGSAGQIVIGTSALSGSTGVLARVPLADPAFTVAGGVMTIASPPRMVDAIGTGIADKVEIRDGNDTVIADGLTIGLPASGQDVIINALEISTGQAVQITLGSITHG